MHADMVFYGKKIAYEAFSVVGRQSFSFGRNDINQVPDFQTHIRNHTKGEKEINSDRQPNETITTEIYQSLSKSLATIIFLYHTRNCD